MSDIVKIEKIAYGGKGMARVDGKVYFVENALPGETVEIEILRDKNSFIEARAVRIENPSPAREKPPCPYFGPCGGCQYQHMSYAEELKWKEIQLREYLQKQFTIDENLFQPIVANSDPYHYRNHITLHRAKDGWGFVNEDNESTIAIQSCLIAKREINDWIATDHRPPTDDYRLKTNDEGQTIDRRLTTDDQRQITDYRLKTNGERQTIDQRLTIRLGAAGKVITSAEDNFFNIPIGNIRLRTHSRCFFQNNLEMTLKIAEKIHSKYESLKPNQFWDLYAGIGTFTALINPRTSQVLCVESNQVAVDALQMNLQNAGLAAEIAPETVENCIEDILDENRKGPILALLDPPRTGLDPIVSRALASGKGPECIIYISCHMGALGRDLRVLTERAYKIESIQAFDMFPRTKHIETLVVLTKN